MKYIIKIFLVFIVISGLIYSYSCKSSHPISNPNYIQFRMVEDSTEIDGPTFKVEATGEMVHLKKEILLNLNDVSHAEIRKQEGRAKVDVSVVFTSDGAEKFSQITGENIGKRLAVLVDDKLIMAPVIMVQIGFGKALVYYDIPEADAKLKVELINKLLKQ